ncbi:MAG: methylglutamate dehydrogenase subunit, partial [Alphaproteobacteria bacterium]|nr:methylglutamate dehydrogenase subunit [Alphaproteobacteria bacterium]
MTAADQSHRLPEAGFIDRSRPIAFTFDKQQLAGYQGDTLASALLGNGIRIVGRSFKYHRPRGLMTAGSDEPNALVELRTGNRREPNTKATTVELFSGLEATSQNRWPSLRFDVSAINQLFAPILGAGFYYKTFMWPKSFWEKLYEPIIRRAAGLGRLSGEPDPDGYEKAYAFCDVLVIGGGPAGLMAALTTGRAGARVILCDEDFHFGGRLLCERTDIDGAPARDWLQQVLQELSSLPNVRLMPRTTVFGAYDGSSFGTLERVSDHLASADSWQPRHRLWNIETKRTILAAGALDRMIAFGGNDRPGVMLSSAVRTYLNRFGVSPGKTTAVFTNNDDGWRTARDLVATGCHLAAVIDSRPSVKPDVSAGLDKACEIILGGHVVETRGLGSLAGLIVRQGDGRRRLVEADTLAVAGGWNPAVGLTCHLGNRPVWQERIASFIPGNSLPLGMAVAGAANGSFSLHQALQQGMETGRAANADLALSSPAIDLPAVQDQDFEIQPLWHVADSKGPAFVDFQNDVTTKDIKTASQEGFRSVEHLKRYTTLGMATDQGKGANVNGVAI